MNETEQSIMDFESQVFIVIPVMPKSPGNPQNKPTLDLSDDK